MAQPCVGQSTTFGCSRQNCKHLPSPRSPLPGSRPQRVQPKCLHRKSSSHLRRSVPSAVSYESAQLAMAVAAAPELLQTVDVNLGDRSYPIYIGQGLLDRSDLLQQHVLGKKVLIVTNETVAPLYLQRSGCCAMQYLNVGKAAEALHT